MKFRKSHRFLFRGSWTSWTLLFLKSWNRFSSVLLQMRNLFLSLELFEVWSLMSSVLIYGKSFSAERNRQLECKEALFLFFCENDDGCFLLLVFLFDLQPKTKPADVKLPVRTERELESADQLSSGGDGTDQTSRSFSVSSPGGISVWM